MPCGHDNLGVALLPILQRGGNGFGQPIGRVFQKHHPLTWKKSLRFHGVNQGGRVFAQVGTREACESHFFAALGAQQR